MDDLEFTKKVLVDRAKNMSLDDAAKMLVNFAPDREALVREAVEEIRKAAAKIRTLREPRTFGHPGEPWYIGPTENDVLWPSYRDLLHERRWRDLDISRVDRASTKILSLMQPPGAGIINTRGLVIGYVQSGKTANYTGLIAKAADVGYRFFVILTGIIEALRQQTQDRIETDLITRSPTRWVQLTRHESDFDQHVNVNAFLTEHTSQHTVAVVKKNGPILRRLLDWIMGAKAEVLRGCPVLLIDDEADLASINTAKGNTRTTINRLILAILSALPKAAYVGFTATPFANVLIDPTDDDIYPKDFIVDLERPDGYFGAERIFGRDRLSPDEPDWRSAGLDMIRIVPDEEVPQLRPTSQNRGGFSPATTPTLRRACLYFWLVTAARYARGQTNSHSTMLIHTTMYASIHEAFRAPIEGLRAAVENNLAAKQAALLEELSSIWSDEQTRVPPQADDESGVSFDDLLPYLPKVLSACEFKVENSFSVERLDYRNPGRIYIVVGGNVLSRGLTLEGLIVSYFVRAASAYDTLLQMGRWFGYRPGYSDLARVWMTLELKGYFFELATVEREIRNDIEIYEAEDLTPMEFGVRIRTNPDLNITSSQKMRNAVDAEMSYRAQRPSTIYFRHQDEGWLDGNIRAAKRLISSVQADGLQREAARSSYVFRGVQCERILDFIQGYQFHDRNKNLRRNLLTGYINARLGSDKPSLGRWNVAVISVGSGELGDIDLGIDKRVNLLNRSKMNFSPDSETAYLKAIMSNSDLVIDLHNGIDTRLGPAQLIRARTAVLPDTGLLLLYPISKDSVPAAKDPMEDSDRVPLKAVAHMMGVAFVFPASGPVSNQKYKTARIPEGLDIEEIDERETENAL